MFCTTRVFKGLTNCIVGLLLLVGQMQAKHLSVKAKRTQAITRETRDVLDLSKTMNEIIGLGRWTVDEL